ncbi:MAG: hypothetical protein KGI71_05330 [Patescibacteria group bacterium]|nr:hypothetical protein [Patescibacteria group bacterium]
MTASDRLMLLLMLAYVGIAAVAAWEQNWPRVLYWLAATAITGSVLWMR